MFSWYTCLVACLCFAVSVRCSTDIQLDGDCDTRYFSDCQYEGEINLKFGIYRQHWVKVNLTAVTKPTTPLSRLEFEELPFSGFALDVYEKVRALPNTISYDKKVSCSCLRQETGKPCSSVQLATSSCQVLSICDPQWDVYYFLFEFKSARIDFKEHTVKAHVFIENEPLGHCFGKAGDDITNEITSALILGLFSIIVGIVGSVFYFKNHHLRLLKLYPETFFKAKDKAREASPLLEKDSHGKEVGDGTIQLQQNSRNPFFTMLPVN